MKKVYVFIAVVVLLLIIVASVTNPSKYDFINWSKEELKYELDNELLSWGIEAYADNLIGSSTDRKNYWLFSIYTYNISETNKVKHLGVYNQFFKITGSMNASSLDTNDNTELNKTAIEEISKLNIKDNDVYTILNFDTEKPIENVKSFTYIEDTKEIPIKIKNKEYSIFFGKNHPNGIDIRFVQEDKAVQVELEEVNEGILDEYGDFADIDNMVMQVGTYDFNDDKIEELIITIGDNLVDSQVWIYSYHQVDDILKINPFHMELTAPFQDKLWIDKYKLMIPYGSQGLFREFVWAKDGFYEKQ